MEKEAVIPPINILIEYKLNMEALRLSHIGNNHSIKPRTLKMPHQNRHNHTKKANTCIQHLVDREVENTEKTNPIAIPPWNEDTCNLEERLKIFIPSNNLVEHSKEEWRDAHLEFMTDFEEDLEYLFIYSDGSLMNREGRRITGYGVVGIHNGQMIFERKGALGKHTKVINAKMFALQMAAKETQILVERDLSNIKPKNIIFYTDNIAAINTITGGMVSGHMQMDRL